MDEWMDRWVGGWMKTVRQQAGVAVMEPPELSERVCCVLEERCSAPHPRSATDTFAGEDPSGAPQVKHFILLQQKIASCVTALRYESLLLHQ